MKSVIILTMPRSGSSLLAGILYRLGVNMGEESDLLLGKHLNKYGCYENQEFLALAMNLLFDAGILINYPKRKNYSLSKMKKIAKKYEKKFQSLVKKYQSDLWGFKEACLIYYLHYFEQILTNPYYIHLKRDYKDTANSMLKTINKSIWKFEREEKFHFYSVSKRFQFIVRALWLKMIKGKQLTLEDMTQVVSNGHQRIVDFLTNKKYLTIELDELLTKQEFIINKIGEFLEIDENMENKRKAMDFIVPELISRLVNFEP